MHRIAKAKIARIALGELHEDLDSALPATEVPVSSLLTKAGSRG